MSAFAPSTNNSANNTAPQNIEQNQNSNSTRPPLLSSQFSNFKPQTALPVFSPTSSSSASSSPAPGSAPGNALRPPTFLNNLPLPSTLTLNPTLQQALMRPPNRIGSNQPITGSNLISQTSYAANLTLNTNQIQNNFIKNQNFSPLTTNNQQESSNPILNPNSNVDINLKNESKDTNQVNSNKNTGNEENLSANDLNSTHNLGIFKNNFQTNQEINADTLLSTKSATLEDTQSSNEFKSDSAITVPQKTLPNTIPQQGNTFTNTNSAFLASNNTGTQPINSAYFDSRQNPTKFFNPSINSTTGAFNGLQTNVTTTNSSQIQTNMSNAPSMFPARPFGTVVTSNNTPNLASNAKLSQTSSLFQTQFDPTKVTHSQTQFIPQIPSNTVEIGQNRNSNTLLTTTTSQNSNTQTLINKFVPNTYNHQTEFSNVQQQPSFNKNTNIFNPSVMRNDSSTPPISGPPSMVAGNLTINQQQQPSFLTGFQSNKNTESLVPNILPPPQSTGSTIAQQPLPPPSTLPPPPSTLPPPPPTGTTINQQRAHISMQKYPNLNPQNMQQNAQINSIGAMQNIPTNTGPQFQSASNTNTGTFQPPPITPQQQQGRPSSAQNQYPQINTPSGNYPPSAPSFTQVRPPMGNFQPQQDPNQQQRPSSTVPPNSSSQQLNNQNNLTNQFTNMSINSANNKHQNTAQKPLIVDLLREKRLLPAYDDNTEIIRPKFPHEFYTNVNCHPDIFRSTLTAVPESQNLLTKSRLPFGVLIHPFKDLESLKVIQSSTIVRCRNCRSYINPFVHFLDNTKWRCNLCYSINELPDDFLFDPVTRSYGDPSKRPEINTSTIEFIAPAEYTLRPPPPAMYLFLFDVSLNAMNTGYLQSACEVLLECLEKLPGDTRTQIGFITYNSCLHFYNLSESLSQPHMMIYPDIDEVILPLPENLMINLNENKETIQTFLQELPHMFQNTYDTDNALGSALTAAFKLLTLTGGRITVMQTCLPNIGVGSLKNRSESIEKDNNTLGPQTDFYKKLALDCVGIHVAVDLFMFNSLYSDLATLSCISKYSGGEIKYYREFHSENFPEQADRFSYDFKRYLTRKIGFEAVMRIRCTRGLSIHTFHGNFFVRSTDLLALPNVNPDSGFGMQISIEETLTDTATVCFQAALLYTSSKGERRIRIHTYCLPVTSNINELINSADQEAVIGLVSKMVVDRSIMHSIKEAKDALVNVLTDYLEAFTNLVTTNSKPALLVSYSLRYLPLYVHSLLKNVAFNFGNIKIDDRVYAMNLLKTMPLKYLLLCIYPNLYAVHNIDDAKTIIDSDIEICLPPRLHLSSENIDRHGVYILDACETIYMWIGRSVNDQFLQQVFNVKSFNELPDHSSELPESDNVLSDRIRNFVGYLYDQRPFGASFICIKEGSAKSYLFFQHIHEDKTENSLSYFEFLKYLNEHLNKN